MASKGVEKRQLHACVAGKDLADDELVEKLQELRAKRTGAVLDTKASFTAAVKRIRRVQADGNVQDDAKEQEMVSLLLKFMPQEFDGRMMGYMHLFEILIRAVKSPSHQGISLLPQGPVSYMFEKFKQQWSSKNLKEDQFRQGLKKLAFRYNDTFPVEKRKHRKRAWNHTGS
eukprot:jgi/Pico_ML_1/51962/g2748.t1